MALILDGTNGLSDVDGTAGTPAIRGSDANTGIFFPAADTIAFAEGGVESMRLDSNGNVGIGTSSPVGTLDVVSPSSSLGINLRGRSADDIGTLSFYTNNGATNLAQIQMRPSDNEFRFLVGGARSLTYYTNGSERMRIDSSGNLLVGGTSSVTGRIQGFAVNTSSIAISAISQNSGDVGQEVFSCRKFDNNSTTSQVFQRFTINNGSAGCGQINANGANSAAFGSFSDVRLKENIVDLPSQLDSIMALRPVEFDYIESEGGGHQVGFIAQEMQEVYPDAVGIRQPDEMLTVTGWDKTTARLVKAIQEQQAIIQSLTARIEALESQT